MQRTDLPTLLNSAGVPDTSALTRVLGSADFPLIRVERVLTKRYAEAHHDGRGDQDIFHVTPHLDIQPCLATAP